MNRFTFILKTGDKIVIDSKLEMKSIYFMSTGENGFVADDGKTYHFSEDAIAAIIVTPLIECPHCHKEMIPTQQKLYVDTMLLNNDTECSLCGGIIEETK